MLLGSNGMVIPAGMAGESQYAGAAEAPAAPIPSGPSQLSPQDLQAIQQKNALMQQQHAQSQRRTNWIVGGTIVAILAIGGALFWKSRS